MCRFFLNICRKKISEFFSHFTKQQCPRINILELLKNNSDENIKGIKVKQPTGDQVEKWKRKQEKAKSTNDKEPKS